MARSRVVSRRRIAAIFRERPGVVGNDEDGTLIVAVETRLGEYIIPATVVLEDGGSTGAFRRRPKPIATGGWMSVFAGPVL